MSGSTGAVYIFSSLSLYLPGSASVIHDGRGGLPSCGVFFPLSPSTIIPLKGRICLRLLALPAAPPVGREGLPSGGVSLCLLRPKSAKGTDSSSF